MSGPLALARSASPPVRLLVLNQFGINVGFYLLIPYLAIYLSDRLDLAAWLIGLVLGVRNLAQQGLFLVGGTLADRFGYRPMIIAGCLLRTGAFALLAVATAVPTLIVASIVTGLAGALFNPAVRAYLAAAAGGRTTEAFALFHIGYQAGILVGPLLGLALTTLDFRLAAAAAAAVFGLLTLAQWWRLPPCPACHTDRLHRMVADWRTVLRNRVLRRFSALMAISYVLSFQVYLALPLALTGVLESGGTVATAALFMISGLLAVAGQAPAQRWTSRLPAGRPLTIGVALMALAFLPPAVAAAGPPAATVAAVLACAALLTAGTLIAYPHEMATVVQLAGDRLVATHYGLYQTVAGIGIAAGTALTGRALDTAHTAGLPALPWLALAAIGAGCALLLHRLARHLPEPAPPPSVSPSPEGARQQVTRTSP